MNWSTTFWSIMAALNAFFVGIDYSKGEDVWLSLSACLCSIFLCGMKE